MSTEAIDVENPANVEKLLARELPSAVNSEKLLAEHRKINGSKVRTRFPPEPNGYLHVGHAKSMMMNFELAFEKLGVAPENRETIFRYDDTNPEAESKEYIDSLREDVAWMGWKPVKVTYTSDYFQELYDFAIELIRRDKAYVCHQSKADIEKSREISRQKIADPTFPEDPNSPWRNRPVEESLKEFLNMKKGKYAANEATLRLKMDMLSPNPNMWDQVAYRIKYMPHPHAGSTWCIYPTYDYTHCIIDSLEHIDYSICTLEFETRRESYYWVLEALDLYRPKVYEMSRLNISYTVLSKRKLLKLVNSGYMRGWDDPRMPTIKGLRRRGLSPDIMNSFCKAIGVTRNSNIVQYERLAAVARSILHDTSPRVMAVLDPLCIELDNFEAWKAHLLPGEVQRTINASGAVEYQIADFPFDATRGSHVLGLEKRVYIDQSDFRVEDNVDYYGLAPNKAVTLKYTVRIRCTSYELSPSTNKPSLLHCTILLESEEPSLKPKGSISWVPADKAVPTEARVYSTLFTVEEPDDKIWEEQLNPLSEVVYPNALVDPSVWKHDLKVEKHVQFERIGFFVVDKDSVLLEESGQGTDSKKRLVFNMTVNLKDSKPTTTANTTDGTATALAGNHSRKEEQAKQLAEKNARRTIPPQEMFRASPEFSAFDEDGVPTHDAQGEKISKSAYKKYKKDWEKQKRLYEASTGIVTSASSTATGGEEK